MTVQSLTALDTASLQGVTLMLGKPSSSTSSTPIVLNGGQFLFLNPIANKSGSAAATILHNLAAPLVLPASQSVEMGNRQRWNAASGLAQLLALSVPIVPNGVTINSAHVVLGDVATAGELDVNSANIELWGRLPVSGAPAIQPGSADVGLSLIGSSVQLCFTPTFVTGTTPETFGVGITATGFVPNSSVAISQTPMSSRS